MQLGMRNVAIWSAATCRRFLFLRWLLSPHAESADESAHSKKSCNLECATWQFGVRRLVAAFSFCVGCFRRMRKALTSQRTPKNHATWNAQRGNLECGDLSPLSLFALVAFAACGKR